MRYRRWIGVALLLAAACGEDNLDDFDDQRRVSRPPPARFDAVFQFTPVNPGDGGGDAASSPADAAPDAGDAAPADAAPPPLDATTNACASDNECVLAVNLVTCDPCPYVTPRARLQNRACVVEYIPLQSIFGYGLPDCVQGCQFNDQPCVDPPRGAECTHRACVASP